MPVPDVPEVAELYGLDPSEFVAARNALAKQLRSRGRRDEAAAVAELRRPSAVAWALNRLAREDPDLLERALAAGARLRDATEAAVGGDASDLRTATADEQAASDAAIDAAVAHLASRGPDLRQRVAGTLRAAVLDDAVAGDLRRGVLATEHEASGFDFATAFTVGAGAGGDRAGDARARRREERVRRAELEGRVRELERRATELTRAADRQEAAARAARDEADAAAAALEAARSQLDGA